MKILIAFLLSLFALAGCASDDEMQMSGEPNVTTDPVSKEPVHTDSPWKTRWNGNLYCFESEENLRKFEAKPTRYVISEEGTHVRYRRTLPPYELY